MGHRSKMLREFDFIQKGNQTPYLYKFLYKIERFT